MNTADRIALQALLLLAGIVGLVIASARIVSALQSETGKPVVSVTRPTPEAVRREANSSPEPEVRKAMPVKIATAKAVAVVPQTPRPAPLPTPWPAEITVDVRPDEWSKLVAVPPGKQVSVTFTLGRVRIEANGKDLGTAYRSPVLEAERTGRQSMAFDFHPLNALNREPKTVFFTPNTRTLRVMSGEKASGSVLIRFFD